MTMKKISEIKEEFKNLPLEKLEEHIGLYQDDERKGVQTFLTTQENKLSRYREELNRLDSISFYEKKYSSYGYVCGIDEVGRGPLAGPVVAGAVILPQDCKILYINDSKKLSPKKREELFDIIKEEAVAIGIGLVPQERIDEINILQATYEAMRMAIANLKVKPGILLNDAVTIPDVAIPQVPIIKGDAKSISIGAASIMAKVYRDRMMTEYDKMYPGYGFASNKGYGSKEHMEALRKLGPTPIHRKSFIKGIWR
ncbi:MAG: ribonuclease HII [Anaerobutyricum sp.]|nr:ribonuclease HII [Lachnospiraceae bacterium]MDY6047209.1 ribonuclease HII [Anaerobutyricum sp.]